MKNMNIDRIAERNARRIRRFLKKYNPDFYNGINWDLRKWFLDYSANAETGGPQITSTHIAVFIEDGYLKEPCVCSYCGTPERDPERRKNANYCSYCGARILERGNYGG